MTAPGRGGLPAGRSGRRDGPGSVEQRDARLVQASAALQSVPSRSIAFRITRSLRMQAVRMTFGSLPLSRSANAAMTGLCVRAGGFQSDAYYFMCAEPGDQCGDAGSIAADPGRLAGGPYRHIEPSLADIDASSLYHLCHLPVPSLQSGLGDLATVRVSEDGAEAPCSPADSYLGRYGLSAPGPAWPQPRRPGLSMAQI